MLARALRETQVGQSAVALCVDAAKIDGIESLEGLVRIVAGLDIRLGVHVLPGRGDVRPYHQSEPLRQAVIAAAAAADIQEISRDACRLRATDHRQTGGRDVLVEPATDAVEGVRRVAIPAREIETAL